MSAKNAELRKTSHHVSDDVHSQTAGGIGKEGVHLYCSATWRGKPVSVTMSADRYAASYHDETTGNSTNKLTPWRVYASEAHFEDPSNNGGRGEPVSGTARSALGKLCEPLVMEWLGSKAYTPSFQPALARMIMRKFRDDYSAARDVTSALAEFRDRLSRQLFLAISDTLRAYLEFEAQRNETERLINEGS